MRLITYVPLGSYDATEFPPDAVRGPTEERMGELWTPVTEEIAIVTINKGELSVRKRIQDWDGIELDDGYLYTILS